MSWFGSGSGRSFTSLPLSTSATGSFPLVAVVTLPTGADEVLVDASTLESGIVHDQPSSAVDAVDGALQVVSVDARAFLVLPRRERVLNSRPGDRVDQRFVGAGVLDAVEGCLQAKRRFDLPERCQPSYLATQAVVPLLLPQIRGESSRFVLWSAQFAEVERWVVRAYGTRQLFVERDHDHDPCLAPRGAGAPTIREGSGSSGGGGHW